MVEFYHSKTLFQGKYPFRSEKNRKKLTIFTEGCGFRLGELYRPAWPDYRRLPLSRGVGTRF